ncbi:glutathione hydrolase 1 proenzyme-like [Paramormyrops kingsleyae]|uniref:glutathione hydrolase 1 proenzyme-like n=1 Tax=Paramormyrops kingsleyae TaxID=1676925 RepID=UPI003B96D32E
MCDCLSLHHQDRLLGVPTTSCTSDYDFHFSFLIIVCSAFGSPFPEVSKLQRRKMVWKMIIILLAIIFEASCNFYRPLGDRHSFSRAAVASDVGPCSEVGRDVMKKGGSAVDASIAALLCVGVLNPYSLGIGGGLFFTIYNATTGKVETINARGTAPLNASEDMYSGNKQLSSKGGLAIAVPGEIRGYELAHRRHGRLPWKDLFEPSIRLARKGFPISNALASAIDKNKDTIQGDAALCNVFCNANKRPLKENETIRFPTLANTYERIATEGPDVYYTGKMAEDIVNDIQEAGGIITLEDLQTYRPQLDESPLKVEVDQYTMWAPSAPSSGPVLALILNTLKGYNLTAASVSDTETKTLTYHRIVEAFRFAYGKRSNLGDPRYLNITNLIANMTSEKFAENLRNKITDNTTHRESYYGPDYYVPSSQGTAQLSVVAEDGSAVAVTSSINYPFGSKVLSRRTGILFNNEMDDFSSPNITNGYGVDPSPNNYIRPGKRPLSSMCPTILTDKGGKVKMVVGGGGGTKITTATALVILNSLFFNYDLRKAVKEPRIHNQLRPNTTVVEAGFNQSVLDGLAKKNHVIEFLKTAEAVVQAILRRENLLDAESDPRKMGYPAGY